MAVCVGVTAGVASELAGAVPLCATGEGGALLVLAISDGPSRGRH